MWQYKLRLLQGGPTFRKFRRWYASFYRFRWRISMAAVVVIFPYQPLITSYLVDWLYTIGFKMITFGRPIAHGYWNQGVSVAAT